MQTSGRRAAVVLVLALGSGGTVARPSPTLDFLVFFSRTTKFSWFV